MYDIWVASNVITFIPNFAKIGQMVQKLKEWAGKQAEADARTCVHTQSMVTL
jgi:hypothetical protein